MSLDLTEDKSTLVQLMAWCHQATSHYMSQCWPRSVSSYGVTRPQWVDGQFHLCWYHVVCTIMFYPMFSVNSSSPWQNGRHFADYIFRWIFVIEIFFILIRISLPAWWALHGFPIDHQQNAAMFQWYVHFLYLQSIFRSCIIVVFSRK